MRKQSFLKNEYQFFDALKTKDRKIRGNCNLLSKVTVPPSAKIGQNHYLISISLSFFTVEL